MADLLLLNASNLPWNPIFPYAFVQVRALARRHGLSVVGRDLLGVLPADYPRVVARLVARHRPRMVGVTLRQADTVFYGDYATPREPPYFPVADTERVVSAVRESTDVPIAAGGFGFTTNPDELFARLGTDLGIIGEADALFERFDDVIAGNYHGVDNLLYRQRGMVRHGARRFGDPLAHREYDDDIVDRMEAFYGYSYLYGANGPTVAVELARGCPYRCYFCTEPAVKGRVVRERDLDVVMADVEFLVSRGLFRFWLVCSELNMGTADLALRVADRFRRFNSTRTGPKARWYAYHLPRWLGTAELTELYQSGFGGGWNDFPSLDDDNLRSCRVPYRARHVVEHLGAAAKAHAEANDDVPQRFSMFLGNAYATPRTVATSLRAYHDAGLAHSFRSAVIGTATRAFPVENAEPVDVASLPLHVFAGPARRTIADGGATTARSDPTFYLPPHILRTLGDVHAVERFFAYAEASLLTSTPAGERDWGLFLATSASTSWLCEQLRARMPRSMRIRGIDESSRAAMDATLDRLHQHPESELRDLLQGLHHPLAIRRVVLGLIVHKLACPASPRFLAILSALGLQHTPQGRVTSTPYQVMRALLPRFDSTEDLLDEVARQFALASDSVELWCVRKLLFESHVVLDPRYRPLLLPEAAHA